MPTALGCRVTRRECLTEHASDDPISAVVGMVREGVHRKGRIIDGPVDDVLLMGLLFDE